MNVTHTHKEKDNEKQSTIVYTAEKHEMEHRKLFCFPLEKYTYTFSLDDTNQEGKFSGEY